MLHLSAIAYPSKTVILSHDYYRFSAAQAEALLRKLVQLKKRMDKKIEGHFSIF